MKDRKEAKMEKNEKGIYRIIQTEPKTGKIINYLWRESDINEILDTIKRLILIDERRDDKGRFTYHIEMFEKIKRIDIEVGKRLVLDVVLKDETEEKEEKVELNEAQKDLIWGGATREEALAQEFEEDEEEIEIKLAIIDKHLGSAV